MLVMLKPQRMLGIMLSWTAEPSALTLQMKVEVAVVEAAAVAVVAAVVATVAEVEVVAVATVVAMAEVVVMAVAAARVGTVVMAEAGVVAGDSSFCPSMTFAA